MKLPILDAIETRYSGLAESDCCLSCGGALELGEPRPGEVCVDLGSGRGRDAIRMAEIAGPTGKAYGIDTAGGMLDKARREARKLGVANVEFLHGAFEALPLPDATVDLVISNCAINHATDKHATWSEVRRVLRPGGRFVVSDIYAVDDVPDEYRTDPAAVAECWAGAVRRDVYLATLAAVGFADVRVLEESKPYAKGKIQVVSFTIAGKRPGGGCCGG